MPGGPGQSHRDGMTLKRSCSSGFLTMRPPSGISSETRWPEGPHCPYCGSTNVLYPAKHKTMPYRCREKECRKRFSVRTKSVMEGSNLGYQTWAVAIYLLMTSLKSVSSMKLHRDLGITQKSAWFLAHRLREAWKDRSTARSAGRSRSMRSTWAASVPQHARRTSASEAREKPHAGQDRGGRGEGSPDEQPRERRRSWTRPTAYTLQSFIENRVISRRDGLHRRPRKVL